MADTHFIAVTTLAVVGVIMFAEAWLSVRHERVLRERGAIEAEGDVYPIMRVIYPFCFLMLALEGGLLGTASTSWWFVGAILFVVSKLLKYWAIFSLGMRWTFLVLVLPGEPLVGSGPYRFLRHPNYAAVAGELIAMAIMMAAIITGPLAILGFGSLMLQRIRVEDRMLERGSQE